jgi:cytochrome c oxidase subunit IV
LPLAALHGGQLASLHCRAAQLAAVLRHGLTLAVAAVLLHCCWQLLVLAHAVLLLELLLLLVWARQEAVC